MATDPFRASYPPGPRRCRSCGAHPPPGAVVCPTCGALLQIEDAIHDLGERATGMLRNLTARHLTRERRSRLLLWSMALVPMLVLPAVAAAVIGARAAVGNRPDHPFLPPRWPAVLLTGLAVANLVVSVLLWQHLGESFLPLLHRALSTPTGDSGTIQI